MGKTTSHQVSVDEVADPSEAPEGAEGDGNRVNLPDPSGTGNDPASQEEDGENRPDWLPEKFDSPEAMAEAYSELEKAQSQSGSDDAEDDDADDDSGSPTREDAEAAAEKAGLSMEDLAREYQENDGSLTDESLEALEEAGFSRSDVDAFIAGQEALANQFQERILEEAGGREEFDRMADWADQNLDADEIAAFNEAMQSQNEAQMRLAMRGLKASYVEAEGQDPGKLIRDGDGDTEPSVKPFRSNDEVVEAISDPRYKRDPAYRARVEARMAAS